MIKHKKIIPSIIIVLAIALISMVAFATGAWFFQNNSATGVIITSNGLFDTVTETFFRNNGTGAFTGPTE